VRSAFGTSSPAGPSTRRWHVRWASPHWPRAWRGSFLGPPAEWLASSAGVRIEAATERDAQALIGRPRESHRVEGDRPELLRVMGCPAPEVARPTGSVLSNGWTRLARPGRSSEGATPTIEVDQFDSYWSDQRARRSSRDEVSHGDWRGHRPIPPVSPVIVSMPNREGPLAPGWDSRPWSTRI
jgi:hypothetical protein